MYVDSSGIFAKLREPYEGSLFLRLIECREVCGSREAKRKCNEVRRADKKWEKSSVCNEENGDSELEGYDYDPQSS
jgi:hypothetical protein